MPVDLVVFQGTSGCNLDCKYCYLPRESRRVHERMPDDVLDKASALILRSSLLGQSPTILWHAGEPMVVGARAFEDGVAIIERNNVHGRRLSYSIQTNATLIDDEWCELFKRYNVNIGVSIDGPAFLHDRNRVGWNGRGSFARAMRGVETLRKYGLKYVAICVLTDESLDHPEEIFHFFVENGFESFGFNTEEIEGFHTSSLLFGANDGEGEGAFARQLGRYRRFMTEITRLWMQHGGRVRVRELELITNKISNRALRRDFVPVQDVGHGLRVITVRADGALSTYSPELASGLDGDRDAFVVGHVDLLEELEDIVLNERYRALRREVSSGIRKCQEGCEYFGVCGGGWPSNKFFENGTFDCDETRSCRMHTKALCDVAMETFVASGAYRSALTQYAEARVVAC